MKKTRSVLAGLLLFFVFACGCSGELIHKAPPEVTLTAEPETVDEPVSVTEDSESILLAWSYRPVSLTEVPEEVNVLAPTWFYAETDENGEPVFRDLNDLGYSAWDPKGYVEAAHAAGISVWGTFVSFEITVNGRLACDEEVRALLAEKIAEWASAYDLDGICLDVEYMDPDVRFDFTETVRALRKALPEDVILSAAVTAPPSEGEAFNRWQCYDYAGLSGILDYVALMAYDNGADEPECTSPLYRVKDEITRLTETTPAEKILLGVPMYGLDYEEVTDDEGETSWIRHTVTPSRARDLRENGILTLEGESTEVGVWLTFGEWDAEKGEHLYEYTDLSEHRHMNWCEDEDSLFAKGELVGEFSLAGAAVWRLEYGKAEEEKALWQGLASGMTEGTR